MDGVSFTAFGRPVQKGSKKGFVTKSKGGKPRAIVVDANNDDIKTWAGIVAPAAAAAMQGRELITGPVIVRAVFFFGRPASHFGTGRNAAKVKPSSPLHHTQYPDLDKLDRCLRDILSGIVYRDDSQVFSGSSLKRWTTYQERVNVEIIEQ